MFYDTPQASRYYGQTAQSRRGAVPTYTTGNSTGYSDGTVDVHLIGGGSMPRSGGRVNPGALSPDYQPTTRNPVMTTGNSTRYDDGTTEVHPIGGGSMAGRGGTIAADSGTYYSPTDQLKRAGLIPKINPNYRPGPQYPPYSHNPPQYPTGPGLFPSPYGPPMPRNPWGNFYGSPFGGGFMPGGMNPFGGSPFGGVNPFRGSPFGGRPYGPPPGMGGGGFGGSPYGGGPHRYPGNSPSIVGRPVDSTKPVVIGKALNSPDIDPRRGSPMRSPLLEQLKLTHAARNPPEYVNGKYQPRDPSIPVIDGYLYSLLRGMR